MELNSNSIDTSKKNNEKENTTSSFWEMAEFNRIGINIFVLSIVACTSAIVAAFFVDGSSQFELTLIVSPTMLTLSTVLFGAHLKWILGIGIFSLLVDMLLVIF